MRRTDARPLESSVRADDNRRRTVVVAIGSGALVTAAVGWATVAAHGRPSPAELAATEFLAASAAGECAVARALTTQELQRRWDDENCTGATIRDGEVVRAYTAATSGSRAVVLVDVRTPRGETTVALGLRQDRDAGRWQVAAVDVACLGAAVDEACPAWEWLT